MSGIKIFWDTNLFIYHIEEVPGFVEKMDMLIEFQQKNNYKVFTSSVTLGEVLVKPFKENKLELINVYEEIFSEIEIINIDIEVSRKFAELRAAFTLKSPDAFQVASAIIGKANIFITNDERLSKLGIKGIKFYSLNSFVEEIEKDL